MVKVPEDIKEKIKALATNLKADIKDVQQKFGEIYQTNENCVPIENEEARCRMAWGILASSMTSTGGEGVAIIIKPISKSSIRKVGKDKRKVADLFCFLLELDEEENIVPEVKYANIVLWQDATDILDDIEIKVNSKCELESPVYKIKAVPDDPQPDFGASYHTGRKISLEEVDIDFEFPNLRDYLNDVLLQMDIYKTLNQIDMYPSEFNTDLRIVKGTVMRADKGNRKVTGEPYGVYDIIDITQAERFTAWAPVEHLNFGQGSELYIIGTVLKPKDGGSVYMNAQFVLPETKTSGIPIKLIPKPVKKAEEEPEEEQERNENSESSDKDESLEFE